MMRIPGTAPDEQDTLVAELSRRGDRERARMLMSLAMSSEGLGAMIRLRRTRHDALDATLSADLSATLATVFAPEHLVFSPIDSASRIEVQEYLMRSDAVHPIDGWDDLRRRLDPLDRRCFGLFHPAMPARPVAFVEIALIGRDESPTIPQLLDPSRPPLADGDATAALLYSISSPEPGLRGIRFGRTMIERSLGALMHELPRLRLFRTLSPIPGFRRWLERATADDTGEATALTRLRLALDGGAAAADHATDLRDAVTAYLLATRASDGLPLDDVARFHLGNRARLSHVQLDADPSPHGVATAYAVMASYEYGRQDT